MQQLTQRTQRSTKQITSSFLPLLLVIIVGAVLRFYHLGAEPLWLDEGETLRFSELSFPELLKIGVAGEPNPPLYYALQKIWRMIVGESEVGFRSLSAIIGVLTIPLMYASGKTLDGHWLGIISAALFATSSFNIRYSQEARAYTLLTAAATLVIWSLVYLCTHPLEASSNFGHTQFYRRRSKILAKSDSKLKCYLAWLAYITGLTIALYTHNTAVLLLVLANLVALIGWIKLGHFNKGFLRNWLIANAIPVAIYSWWLPFTVKQTTTDNTTWVPFPTPKDVFETLGQVLGYPFLGELSSASDLFRLNPNLLSWGFALFLIWGLAILGFWKWRHNLLPKTVTTTFLIGLPLLALIISFRRPIFIPRVLIWATIPFFLLVAAGILAFRSKTLIAFLVMIVLMIQLQDTVNYYHFFKKEPWNQISSLIERQMKADDAIILFPSYIESPFKYYFKHTTSQIAQYGLNIQSNSKLNLLHRKVREITLSQLPSTIAPYNRIWLVTRNVEIERIDPKNLVLHELEKGMIEIDAQQFHRKSAIKVYLFQR